MKSTPIKRRLRCVIPENLQENPVSESALIDAAFRITGNTQLQLNVHDWGDKAAEYLEHAVARTPGDLRSHVQRLNIYIGMKDAEAAYGALVDLFIVLREQGRPLRERMLKVARTLIGEYKHNLLIRRLEAGITATDAVSSCRTSLLSKGLSGTNQLVTRIRPRETQRQDPLDEAHDHLEYGQIDEARKVLEAAILSDPSRPEIHWDLLEIYKSTNASEQFFAIRQRISTDTNPLADAWRELAVFFAEKH